MSTHDPTAKKGADAASGLTPAEKIDSVLELTKSIGTAMFTSRSPDGKLASRAMIPATTEDLVFSFYFNKDSGKTNDLQSDDQVNLSYLNPKTGDWVSISGKGVINTDKNKVKKHWSSGLKAWFDDKKDGKHTGDENDPRVALIDVHPEVRGWTHVLLTHTDAHLIRRSDGSRQTGSCDSSMRRRQLPFLASRPREASL